MSLLSTVFVLTPKTVGTIRLDQGRALYDYFLQRVGEINSDFATALHDEDSIKPFTISPIFGNFNPQKGNITITPEEPFHFRLTSYNSPTTEIVTKIISNTFPDLLLGDTSVKVEHDPSHPWNKQDTYEGLIGQTLLNPSKPDPVFETEFLSTTAFHHRKDNNHLVFPLPESVFGSWLMSWNKFSPLSLPSETKDYAYANVVVSRFHLKSSSVRYQVVFNGFTGLCRFRHLETDAYWSRVLQALWEFSFYCGTGHHTTIGMGQTSPVIEVKVEN
jgi:CRISPR-associated endoribonuclease Cas6